MATLSTTSQETTRQTDYPAANWRFNLLVAGAAFLFIFGMFLDGWAHNHGLVDDTFFTPWHMVLYGSFGLVGAIFVGAHLFNVQKGFAWTKALPRGYMLGLVGVLIFAFGGFGDMVWHETFGVEENIEALFSPSHLMLAVGAFLFVGSPFRAAWLQRKRLSGWQEWLPMILSATMALSMLTFFTQFAFLNGDALGLVGPRPTEYWVWDMVGTTSAIIGMGVMVAMLLFMVRRWQQLPFGTFTAIFALNALLMIWMDVGSAIEYVGVAAYALGGLVADGLLLVLKPTTDKPYSIWLIGAMTPFAAILAFLAALHWMGLQFGNGGLWWEIHMWLGLPVMVGLEGLLLSVLVFPPAIPEPIAE